MDLSLANVAGLAAGGLIVLVGLFVLLARPQSSLHRLFFLLALMDGMSTLLFRLAFVVDEPASKAYFVGTYWYHFVAFIALLALFGFVFPKPLSWAPAARVAPPLVILVACGLLVAYVADHGLFWRWRGTGFFPIEVQPLGSALGVAFTAVIALLLWRLTRFLLREPSGSHRHQSAFVLGGMALAYAPAATTITLQALSTPVASFVTGRLDFVLARWAYALTVVVLVVSAAALLRDRREAAATDRKFVLASYALVALMGLVAFAFADRPDVAALLRTAALLAYPVLLGYAIARYEVFDIDAKVRRATMVTLLAATLTATFVLAENALEGVLADRLLGGISSDVLSGTSAALLTAIVFIPVSKAARKVSGKLVPELSRDELHERKLDVYRHSLAGALADGIVQDKESRTLQALRESLGISDTDHTRVLGEVQAAYARAA